MSRQNLATLDRDIGQVLGRPLQEAMAHGIENDMIYGGLIAGQSALQDLYDEAEIANCIMGTRRVTWDGCVYKYGRALEALRSCFGAMNSGVCVLSYSATVVSACAVGGTTITVTLSGRSANDLEGGRIVLHPADWGNNMTRRIVSNTDSNTTVDITFAGGLSHAMRATSDRVTIYENPYKALTQINNPYASIVGAPARSTQALYYMWNQTWGPWFGTWSDAATIATGQYRSVVWGGDGSLNYADADANAYMQHAGFILNSNMNTDKTFEGPEIMLQISP